MSTSSEETNRFELRDPLRSFLTVLKKQANADSAVLYLIEDDMDAEEKVVVFNWRFEGNTASQIKKVSDPSQYDVLKFIGVSDAIEDKAIEAKYSRKTYWKFDYKVENRPDKYIVFRNSGKDKQIEGEGITGLAARTQKIILLRNSQGIQEQAARIGRSDIDDTARNVHPKCNSLLAIPIIKIIKEDGKDDKHETVGVIRLDIYVDGSTEFDPDFIDPLINIQDTSKPKKTTGNSKSLPATDSLAKSCYSYDSDSYRFLNDLTKLLIGLSKTDAKAKSYRSIYKSSCLLENFKGRDDRAIESMNAMEGKVFILLRHLFFVFSRYTYIGHEEIVRRVMYFIDDLCDIVNLKDLHLKGDLEAFRKHEDLMLYDIEKYRDHLMHSFHVFVSGFIILQEIGLENIASNINKRLKSIGKYKNLDLKIENIIRIWTMVAFYHDISYLLEKYDQGIQEFLEKILGITVPLSMNWSQLLAEEHNYASCLLNISELFTCDDEDNSTNKNELLVKFFQVIEKSQDHGVLSALLLVKQLDKLKQAITDEDEDHSVRRQEKEVEVYLAALAISIHNDGISDILRVGDKYKLSFESFPIEFLLVYCDTIQEWGRMKNETGKIVYDSPELEKLDIKLLSRSRGAIKCVLNYMGGHPNCQKLNDIINSKFTHLYSNDNCFTLIMNFLDENDSLTLEI